MLFDLEFEKNFGSFVNNAKDRGENYPNMFIPKDRT